MSDLIIGVCLGAATGMLALFLAPNLLVAAAILIALMLALAVVLIRAETPNKGIGDA